MAISPNSQALLFPPLKISSIQLSGIIWVLSLAPFSQISIPTLAKSLAVKHLPPADLGAPNLSTVKYPGCSAPSGFHKRFDTMVEYLVPVAISTTHPNKSVFGETY